MSVANALRACLRSTGNLPRDLDRRVGGGRRPWSSALRLDEILLHHSHRSNIVCPPLFIPDIDISTCSQRRDEPYWV